jgi:hypothetical protein
MIFAKLKAYALIGLSIALAVMYALFNREKAARYKDKAKVAHRSAQTLTEANKAIREADIKVKEKLDAKDPDRTHFQ